MPYLASSGGPGNVSGTGVRSRGPPTGDFVPRKNRSKAISYRPDCGDLIVVADAGARDAAENGRQEMIDSPTNAWRGDGGTSNIDASLPRGAIADAAAAERVRSEARATDQRLENLSAVNTLEGVATVAAGPDGRRDVRWNAGTRVHSRADRRSRRCPA